MKKLLILSSVVLFSSFANAGAFVEPYAGYEFGEAEATAIGGASSSVKQKGFAIGGRVGYEFMLPWVALDVKYFTGKDDGTPETDIKRTDMGITGGVTLPVVRPYVGYILKSEAKSDDGTGEVKSEGTGFKLGLGLTPLPFIDFNIEYSTYDIKKIDGADISTYSLDKFKANSVLIGVGMTF